MKMPQKLRSFGFILLACFFLAGTVLSACGTKTTEQTEEQTEEAAEEASEESQEHPADSTEHPAGEHPEGEHPSDSTSGS